jgi:hypothetical protein
MGSPSSWRGLLEVTDNNFTRLEFIPWRFEPAMSSYNRRPRIPCQSYLAPPEVGDCHVGSAFSPAVGRRNARSGLPYLTSEG